jgi:DNA modification methylase
MKTTSQTRRSMRIKNPPSYFRSRGPTSKSPMKRDGAIGMSKPSPQVRPAPANSGEQFDLKNQKLMKVRANEIPAEFAASPLAGRFWHPAVEMRPVKELRRSKRNARTHSKKQRDKLISAVRRFGFVNPLIVDEQGHILAGHLRHEVACELGLKLVPVIQITHLTELEKRAFALAENRIALDAGWDRAALAAELGELAVLLPECNLNIDITGFEPFEFDALMGDLVDLERDPADELSEIAKVPVSCRGDLWLLGRHRLGCGNARAVSDVKKLMGQERAAMVITDPPYNVAISSIQGRGRIKHREFIAASGELSKGQYIRFLVEALSLAAKHSVTGAIHFIFMDWRHQREILAAGEEVYGEPKNLVVWVKTNAGQGTFYRSQHELIFVFKYGDAPHINNFELGQHGRNRSNVWTYAGVNTFRAGRLDDLTIHPTVKPVALVADAMRDCARRGDIVLDPFMGSGTTIMAAERVGRRGYGLELDPLYVDAAVRRWQAYTGRDAILNGTGQPFDEIAAIRSKTGGAS